MSLQSLAKRLLLRKTAFSGAYAKLAMLYSLEDPWNLSSDLEAYRFKQTASMLQTIAPRFSSILELGSGEGHQSEHLLPLTDRYQGIELSEKAVKRARQRCPEARFAVGRVENAGELTQGANFELTTACEVLYYLPDAGSAISDLQKRTRFLFVSNYLPRAEVLRPHLTGPGWRRLPEIRCDDTVWECALWSRDECQPDQCSAG